MMDVELHNKVVLFIKNHHDLPQNRIKQLIKNFPSISHDTLLSILLLEYQKVMKTNHGKLCNQKHKFWNTYKNQIPKKDNSNIILSLSQQFNVMPCMMAKMILNQYFDTMTEDQSSVNINIYLRDTTLIPDTNLAYEVFLCTLFDGIYSPLMETLRSSMGQQYEIKLYQEALHFNLSFRDEEYLRRYGYDKTPDCKLDVPVAVDGFIINWIESKALFGDEEIHREYMKNQYLSYWNRFGPGLVIYWLGFLKSIIDDEKRFIIRDSFPGTVTNIRLTNFDLYEDSELNKC